MFGADVDKEVMALLMKRAGVEPACPVCKADLSGTVRANLMNGKVIYCKSCGNRTNWKYGTDLYAAKISAWYYLCLSIIFSVYTTPTSDDYKLISNALQLDLDSVKYWHKKITGNGAA